MQKRYQVFVSSTYSDLAIERAGTIESLLRLNCFPASMEIFGAASTPPWDVIRDTIDLCDYFIVISAGKYGTLTSEGLSYTEKEFNYAQESGKSCLAFIHHDLRKLPGDKLEASDVAREKLRTFHANLRSSLLCEHYEDTNDLKYKVFSSLHKEIGRNPQAGWVRSSEAADPEVYRRLAEVQEALAGAQLKLSQGHPARSDAELLQRTIIISLEQSLFVDYARDDDDRGIASQIPEHLSIYLEVARILTRVGQKLYSGTSRDAFASLIEERLSYSLSKDIEPHVYGAALGSSPISFIIATEVAKRILLFLEADGLLETKLIEQPTIPGGVTLQGARYALNEHGRRVYARAMLDEVEADRA